jgi:hypothetical protein
LHLLGEANRSRKKKNPDVRPTVWGTRHEMKKVELSNRVTAESHCLIVDDELWEDSSGFILANSVHGTFWDGSVTKIRHMKLADFQGLFGSITVWLSGADIRPADWGFREFQVSLDKITENELKIKFDVWFDPESWAQAYSINDLADALESIVSNHSQFLFRFDEGDRETRLNGFGVFMLASKDSTIESILLARSDLDALTANVRARFEAPNPGSIAAFFDFPVSVKSACEQYLLYFGQFLRDLGIEACTELKEQANRVLFSITPLNEKQALDQIRNALEIYLQMPRAPNFAFTEVNSSDIAVSQLMANVLHLQSQIALARAIVEMKDATISTQQTELAVLRNDLDLREFSPASLANGPSREKEPIIAGVVSVKKYAWSFLEVDFPAILRKLKRIRK